LFRWLHVFARLSRSIFRHAAQSLRLPLLLQLERIRRRAGLYRQGAQQLATRAAGVRGKGDRRHLPNLAAIYERTAGNLAPPPAASEAQSIFRPR
jgi:hypothetical protein